MTLYGYPKPEQIPIQADQLSYIRHAKRSRISAVEVAHLAHGIVARADSSLVFLNSLLCEIKELYTLLVDAAQSGQINNATWGSGSGLQGSGSGLQFCKDRGQACNSAIF